MGRHHARLLRRLEQFEFIGAVDPDGDLFGALTGTPPLSDVDELLKLEPDAAVVAVPTVDHKAVAHQLATAGVSTLVEKPLAESAQAAREVGDHFEAAGVRGAVGHVERFNPALVEMRRKIHGGDLGRVFSITTERVGPFPHRIKDVGVVKDLATHDIDIISWLTGSPIVSVSAQMAHQMGRIHEDLVTAIGSLADGTLFQLEVNWLTPTKKRQVTALGERGALVADLIPADLTFFENAHVPTQWDAVARITGVSEGDVVRYAIPKPEPLRSELEAFAALVSEGRPSEIALMSDGVRILEVAEAILESAEHGGELRHP
jgi:predicted dehydrogenase